jgi:serine/threonine protein kinase
MHSETLIMSDDSEGNWDETEPRPAPAEPARGAQSSNARATSSGEPGPSRDQPDPKRTKPVKIGGILKGRFKLLEIIGYGGMGYVFKALDLVKVQAQDSNPYVAIKVLSNAFKKHSKAFIAMQREASKAQRLAHPNIATVYDFDHDDDTIYMTMELLHGQPFDKLIAQLPSGGLPKQIALRYIEDLCHGLAYAHKQQLIHCDLKPANIFLCDSGAVKLLDFGITRALKKERAESKDNTLFDPAKLKALTPAYASPEMFHGGSPDPRDDIFAVACVTYELLTGNHPYKKVASDKALELNLKPPPVKGLSRRQQKALHRPAVGFPDAAQPLERRA